MLILGGTCPCSRQPYLYHNGPEGNGKHIVWVGIRVPVGFPEGSWEYQLTRVPDALLSQSTVSHIQLIPHSRPHDLC